MDIKAIIDGALAAFQHVAAAFRGVGQYTAASSVGGGSASAESAGGFLSSLSGLILLFLVVSSLAYIVRSGAGKRVQAGLHQALVSNWQLALLGSTGVVLSLASGWTTWDGMRNFTGEPILSLMITFGIQGVMLIVAWLIGESFASGMNQGVAQGERRMSAPLQTILGSILGILTAVALLALALSWSGVLSTPGFSVADPGSWASSDKLLFIVIGFLIVAGVLLFQQDIVKPYLQGGTVILRNMALWLMFLACMATSVFFSFDSLFSAIFPKDERKRAADIRSVNQVSGVVADIGTLIQKRRIEHAEELFRSEGWSKFETQLDAVEQLGRLAPDEVRQQMEKELQQRQQRRAELQEKQASAKSGESGLASRKVQITEELSRLEGQRPEAQTLAAQQKSVVTEIEKRLDEQRARLLAEEKGVEGSGKIGRGKFWREAKAGEEKIRSELQVANQRYQSHATRLDGIVSRVAAIKRELASIDGEIAKYRGESETAGKMIDVANTDGASEPNLQANPIALVAQMRRDRDAFRLDPQEAPLARIQEQCQILVTTSARVASLRDEAAAVDCDPRHANQAAAVVFALNAGAAAYAANCAGGEKLPSAGGTDALLAFGRKCLQDSGLPSRDTAAMGANLASIDLSRDDKAHRFVVTWNAFTDGNRLAYLALAIAIAIDSLVFMSGLFGANAVRSPLSEIATNAGISPKRLERLIDNALAPDNRNTAKRIREALKPIRGTDGFSGRIFVDPSDPYAGRIMGVLAAGSDIGAVRHVVGDPDSFEVHSRLSEYLGQVASKTNAFHGEDFDVAVKQSLLPDTLRNSQIVLEYMHLAEDRPSYKERLLKLPSRNGFLYEVLLSEVAEPERLVVKHVLNAGAASNVVQRLPDDRYAVHKDLHTTLMRIRSECLTDGSQRVAQNRGVIGGVASPKLLASDPAVKPPELSDGKSRFELGQDSPVSRDGEYQQVAGEIDSEVVWNESFEQRLGLPEGSINWLLSSSERDNLADRLQWSLARIEERDALLQAEIAGLRNQHSDVIDQTSATLKLRYSSPRDQKEVDRLAIAIKRVFPLIVMRNGGQYEDMLDKVRGKIVQHMPAGNSSQWRRDWVSAIDEHNSELAEMRRESYSDWEDVIVELKRFNESLPDSANTVEEEQEADSRPPLFS